LDASTTTGVTELLRRREHDFFCTSAPETKFSIERGRGAADEV